MLAGLRQQMNVAEDAEWQVLQSRVAKVAILARQARDLRDARAAMEGPKLPKPGGDPAGPPPAYTYPAQIGAALVDLGEKGAARAELANPEARGADVQVRLAAFRRARAEAERLLAPELRRAQDELRELVTPRQELALVASGLLD